MVIDTHHPVYELVRKIPVGKVLTYGAIADACGVKNPRYVGYLLHHNPDQDTIPCHRVVSSLGKCAKNFAFGFATAQEQLLKNEGVVFIGSHVDLASHMWDGR